MVEMLGRPWARRTTSSASKLNFLAQVAHTRATAGVESTRTPSMSKSRPRQRISMTNIIVSLRRGQKGDGGSGGTQNQAFSLTIGSSEAKDMAVPRAGLEFR